MYFLRGRLPWQSLPAKTKKEKYRKIMEKKRVTPLNKLCKGFPDEMVQYIQYCRGLKFEEKPDYNLCKHFFGNAFAKNEYEMDYNFDWVTISKKSKKQRF